MNRKSQLAAIVAKMQELLSANPDGLTGEQATQFNQLDEQAKSLQTAIAAEEKMAQYGTMATPPAPAPAQKAQLPLNGGGERSADAPTIAQFSNLWKYDNLDATEVALGVALLDAGSRKGHGRGVSEDMRRALAVRLVSEETKARHWSPAKLALKSAMGGMELKANELNQSTLANYGDEWVTVSYAADTWPRIVQDSPILSMIPTVEIPEGAESINLPLQGTPPTFYLVAQASTQSANPGITTNTVPTSRQGTASKTISASKIGAATTWTGELTEDSIIAFLPELRASIQQESSEVMEHVIIDGDTATGATTNINDIGGTPAATDVFLAVDGFRKLALVTNTANSRDGGVLAIADFMETLKLMGLGGRNALRKDRVAFIIDLYTHWKTLELAETLTRDVFSNPTIESGVLTNLYGVNVYATANMHRANQDATYGLRTNTAGKIDLDTASNNTKGSILAVRFDQWRMGWKRRITFEVERVPRADAYELTALMRFGLAYRDTEASAISYNLTV